MITNSDLKKSNKLTSIVGTLTIVLSLLFAVFGFYTHTNTTLEEQASTIKEVKQDVVLIKKKINEADVYQGVSQAEYTALKDKVTGIEKTVDNIDAKLDKVLIQTK